MRFPENSEDIVFFGPPRVRKIHLVSALRLVTAQHRLSTYYVNSLNSLKRHFENPLYDKLKILVKYRILIIGGIFYLPTDVQGAYLFFQHIARCYEKTSTDFTSNKTFSQ